MKSFALSFQTVLAAAAMPAEPTSAKIITEMNPPIVGVWELALEKKVGGCTEMYNFKADNKLSVVSGEEWTYGTYQLIYKKDMALPVLMLKTTFDDNNMDCSGNQKDQSGESFAAYFKQTDARHFELCADGAGKKCFMQFFKRLP